jgi:quercetin dioxygenase-like cupin family protein
MRFLHLFLSTVFFAVSMSSIAQHKGHATKEPVSPLTFQGVLSQALSDSLLSDYKMEASVMTIAPGGVDTVSHYHDSELFGYVLEGSVEIALVTKNPKTYKPGEMFYERRNILHTLTRNGSSSKPARVLLIFIIKNGRPGYTAAFPDKTK